MNTELTEYQGTLIDQFISIAASITPEEAQQILLENDWNLEILIIHYYQSRPQLQRDFISTYSESLLMSSQDRSFMHRLTSAFNNTAAPLLPGTYPSENSPSKLHQFLNKVIYSIVIVVQFVILLPLLVIFKIMGWALVVVFDKVIPVFNKVFGLRLSPATYYARKNLTNPTERSRRFIYEFDEFINNKPLLDVVTPVGVEDGIKESDSSLMEINRPNFLECSYTNALYLLKKEFKWLLIYIQSDEHEDKEQFIRQVLLNDQFLQFLKNNQIITWGGNLKESESYQVANNFNISGFPFLGLIGLTMEDSAATPQVSLVCKIQGVSISLYRNDKSINTPKIIKKFHKTLERLNPNLITMRAESQLRDQARNIRAQQDLAYQVSLARDRRRDEERQRQEELQRELERLQREQELQKQYKTLYLLAKYKELTERESQLDLNDKTQTSRIAFRLNNGERLQHNFHKTFTLFDIYLYIDCILNDIPQVTESISASSSYEHRFNFKLISVMPRVELPCDSQLIGDTKIVCPSGNLVIEELE